MRKFSFVKPALAGLLSFCLLGGVALAQEGQIGFVNFKSCIEKSRSGQQEKTAFEALKRQMSETLEKSGAELEVLAEQLEDKNFMDGLSPTAEEELKKKYQALTQELGRYQNQYYQLLNQANYRMLQVLHTQVSQAAEVVRAAHKLALIVNEDSTFAYEPSLNLTEAIIQEMDRTFDKEAAASEEHFENAR